MHKSVKNALKHAFLPHLWNQKCSCMQLKKAHEHLQKSMQLKILRCEQEFQKLIGFSLLCTLVQLKTHEYERGPILRENKCSYQNYSYYMGEETVNVWKNAFFHLFSYTGSPNHQIYINSQIGTLYVWIHYPYKMQS